MDPNPNCGSCVHFFRGQCRRFPPQVTLAPTDNQHPIMYDVAERFPSVEETAWCGEFKRKRET